MIPFLLFKKQHGDHDYPPTLTKPMPKLDEYKDSIGKKIMPNS
jgi:hypothetical protein